MEPLTPHLETIKVYLRFRPLLPKELQDNDQLIWKHSETSVSLDPELMHFFPDGRRPSLPPKQFSFTECFSTDTLNPTIYESTCKPLLSLALEGYNFTIFAYGQTGSGKTFTLIGSENTEISKHRRRRSFSPFRGLVPTKFQVLTKGILLIFLQDLFETISFGNKTINISCSYIEIYNENVFDLLASDSNENLTVNEDPTKGFYIKGLSEKPIRSFEDAIELISIGENIRKYGNSEKNQRSSRSHIVFRVSIVGVKEDNSCFESCVNFVDLAGSERLSSKKLQNVETLTEGKHINTSLFYLCSVIYKLSEKNSTNNHIPYRNSNLTKILRNSIGGNSFTSIIFTASPGLASYEMTLSTLHLASVAKTITNKVVINYKTPTANELLVILQKGIQTLRIKMQSDRNEGLKRNNLVENKQKRKREVKVSGKQCYGWMRNVGDIAGGWEKSCGGCIDQWRLFENEANDSVFKIELTTINEKYLEACKHNEELAEQYNVVSQRLNELSLENKKLELDSEKSVIEAEKKRLILSSLEAQVLYDCELIKGLKKVLSIIEGRYFDHMSIEQIRYLERFYLEGIDKAKEARLQKVSNRVVLGEISERNYNELDLSALGVVSNVKESAGEKENCI